MSTSPLLNQVKYVDKSLPVFDSQSAVGTRQFIRQLFALTSSCSLQHLQHCMKRREERERARGAVMLCTQRTQGPIRWELRHSSDAAAIAQNSSMGATRCTVISWE